MVKYEYRDYLPALGKWAERDPLGEASDVNLYRAMGNSVVNAVDPLGLYIDSLRGRIIAALARGRVAEAAGLAQLLPEEESALASRTQQLNNAIQRLVRQYPAEKFQCDKLASKLKTAFDGSGFQNARIMQLTSNNGAKHWYNQQGIKFATQGYHEAVRVGDMVYDSAIAGSEGMAYDEYIATLRSLHIGANISYR